MTSSTDQQQPPPSSSSITDWNSIIGKNVKTVDYQDAGKVIGDVDNEEKIIISYEGSHSRSKDRAPMQVVQGVDGRNLHHSKERADRAEYEIRENQNYAE